MINLPEGVDLNELLLFLRNIGLQSSNILRDFEDGSISLYDSSENLHPIFDTKDPVTAAEAEEVCHELGGVMSYEVSALTQENLQVRS